LTAVDGDRPRTTGGALLELARRASARLPAEAGAKAHMHLFDTLVAGLTGASTREGENSSRHLASATLPGQAPAPADIVLALARRIRATELDDLQLESVTTAGAAVVPALTGAAAVSAAAGLTRDADAVLGALAAGYDTMFALGLATGGPVFLYDKGGWPSLAAAGPAAAATAARLLGLDAEGIAHALALALVVTPRTVRGAGEDGRWLSFGLATAAGFQAALAAGAGARGDLTLLDAGSPLVAGDGPFGGIGAVLSRDWVPGLGLEKAHLKRWASAGQVAAAIDAFGAVIESRGLVPDHVAAVDVHVPPAYRRMIDAPNGTGRIWSLMSAQYQLAVRLCHPGDLYDCARAELRGSAAFVQVMRVVRVHDAADLATRHPRSYPARVTVSLTDGTVLERLSDGRSPSPAWNWPSVLGKARALAARTKTGALFGEVLAATLRSADSQSLLVAAAQLAGEAPQPNRR
jgi:2-methylcitrate dehydratase PrpD